MSQRLEKQIERIVFPVMGAIAGLACAWAIIVPVAQCLIDSDDDNVLLYTTRYFGYAAPVFALVCCVLGGLAGRALSWLPLPDTNPSDSARPVEQPPKSN
jgi:hypothetical protein